MIIIDEVNQVLDRINAIPDPVLRNHEMSMAVTVAICAAVYYICLAIVALVLGRRIINATLKAWRESRRDPV